MGKKLQQKQHKSIIDQIIRIANTGVMGNEHIEELFQRLTGTLPPSQQPIRPTLPMTGNDLNFAIYDDGVTEYSNLLECLLQKEGWSNKYSEEYLDNALQQLLATLLQEGRKVEYASAERLFTQLRESYIDYNQKRVVYVPVCGINLTTDTYDMANITFRRMTEDFFEKLLEQIDNVTLQTLNPSEEKAASMQNIRRRLEYLKGSVIAEFSVVADSQRARERAEDEVNLVLDLLRYSAAILYPKGLRVAIGLQGEVISTIRTTVVLSLDGQSFNWMNSRQGPLSAFDLSSSNIAKMEEIGILKIAKLLKQPEKQTNFEQTILRGIHWFATSESQVKIENALLNLITCLETFFAPHDGRSITTAVAEGTARILATELQHRKAIVNKVKDLYGMRSGISHGGKKAILEKDLNVLRDIAKEVIFQMIERKSKFSTQKEFALWLDEKRLVG